MNLKLCEIVQQVQFLDEDTIKRSLTHTRVKDWAYIKHDKDTDSSPHWHIAVRLKDSCDTKYVAEWFSVPEQYVNKVKGRWSDMLKYLTHGNAKDKHQYQDEEVLSNFDWKIARAADTIESVIERIQIGDIREYNLTKSVDGHTYARFKNKILAALEWYRMDVLSSNERNIKVMFITGPAGVGKTTYAKIIAEKNGSVCVSSSGNDPMQDYKGEQVLILDDLRDDVFNFADFMKLLDNHTGSSVRSRYSNKAFIGDLIIVTSIVSLRNWYSWAHEDKSQLYRRITGVMEMSEDEINAYEVQPNGAFVWKVKTPNPVTIAKVIQMTKAAELENVLSTAMHSAAEKFKLSEDVVKELEKKQEEMKKTIGSSDMPF